jgi:hypothetical protein
MLFPSLLRKHKRSGAMRCCHTGGSPLATRPPENSSENAFDSLLTLQPIGGLPLAHNLALIARYRKSYRITLRGVISCDGVSGCSIACLLCGSKIRDNITPPPLPLPIAPAT